MASLKSSSNYLVVKETAKLNWTIDKFAQVGVGDILSPEFSPPNGRDKFKLIFNISPDKKTTFIVLTYSGTKKFFRYRFSIIDGNEVKHHTREYRWNSTNSAHNFNSTSYISFDQCKYLLVNGCLKIYCEVGILSESVLSPLSPQAQLESFGELSENYETLLESGKFSDFIVAIGGKQFHVPKNILAARSAVFAAMLEHEETIEVKQGRVVIKDVPVDVFELMIRHIYTGKVDQLGEHAADLFVAADKYQLDNLKSICEHSLISGLTTESVSAVLHLSDMLNAEELKSKCFEYIVEHAKDMKTEGWKELAQSATIDLVAELFEKLANKDGLIDSLLICFIS